MGVYHLTAAEYFWGWRKLKGIWAVGKEKSGVLKKAKQGSWEMMREV